jgi:hypothetical protein
MTRFIVFLIAAYVIYYYLFKNSLKSKTSRNTTQRHKDKKTDTDIVATRLKEIAYVFYSTVKDSNTCDVCMALDGRHMLPGHKLLQEIKPPHAGCKSPKGCRCTLVYVTRDEEGSREIESLLKRRGGVCDRQTIERERTG